MSDYRWTTNLRAPISRPDQDYLDRLKDYRIGAPQVAQDRPNAYTQEHLNDFNIVGIYTTAFALSRIGPEAFTVAKAREQLGAEYTPLESHLAKYLDADLHLRPR